MYSNKATLHSSQPTGKAKDPIETSSAAIQDPSAKCFNFAPSDVEEHPKITHQGVNRILKRRWLVLLKEKMTDPCKSISGQGNEQEGFRCHCVGCVQNQQNYKDSPEKMKLLARLVPVLEQVVGVELVKRFGVERFRRPHCHRSGRN